MSTVELIRTDTDGVTDSVALRQLSDSLREAQQHVLDHPIYGALNNLDDLSTFMEYHVFAVWDFMLLLKWLQRTFTCIEIPWLPPKSTLACRLMNEIVLAEESDAIGDGYTSHFGLYLDAMEDIGADTSAIRSFVKLLGEGVAVPEALGRVGAPAGACEFVMNTWDVVANHQPHEIAAAFALTREDLIPQMFERVIAAEAVGRERMQRFVTYLERHIQVDADEHTPMAFRLLDELCGDDARKWQECEAIAKRCFEARYQLWTGVSESVLGRTNEQGAAYHVLARVEVSERVNVEDSRLVVRGGHLQLWSRGSSDEPRCHFDFTLPQGLRADEVVATLHDGLLEVKVPNLDNFQESATRVELRLIA